MIIRVIGMIVAIFVACALPNIPLQPDEGLMPSLPSNSPLVNERPLPGGHVLQGYADGLVAIRGIPWYHQGEDRTCAQANIASLLQHWGVDLSYRQVVAEMNPLNLPTDVHAISQYLSQKGLHSQDYRLATPNFLKGQIHKGRPALVLLDFGSLESLHYVLVTGYNDTEGYFLVSDPIEAPHLRLSYPTFTRMWDNRTLRQMAAIGDRYSRIAFDVWRSP